MVLPGRPEDEVQSKQQLPRDASGPVPAEARGSRAKGRATILHTQPVHFACHFSACGER